jgi:acyl-coenzyme A synthetase/AMP-(fatty) acid ligase/thioesterase domain-containing protein/acyl carrier protein
MVLSPELRSVRAEDNGFKPRAGFLPFRLADTEQSIPERFSRIAATRGEAIAVVDSETAVSYRALHSRATAIAAALSRDLGDRSGPVMMRLPAGVPAIEALLGVLFAGRAYLFVDPVASDDEIRRIEQAASPAAIVDDVEQLSHFGVPSGTPVDRIRPHDLACLFSTSGSTGASKLVGLSHRSVLFDVGRQINDLYLGPDDRFDLLFAPSFSASLSPIFTALLTGGELHILNIRSHLATLGRWQEHARITISTMAVSTLRALCASVAAGSSRPRPRLISVGGEPLLAKDVRVFNDAFPPPCVLQNALASTEARTYAQYFVPRVMQGDGPVPIGWPVAEKEIVLVGETGLPVPAGEAGEISICSRFLAEGYVNDPALTLERFVPQPDGRVLFRTRDRGRFGEDGSLVFLGRADSMVKVRGYRVEPEAVEAILARHDGVSHSVVIARELVPGEPSLVAYVVPCAAATLTDADVRTYVGLHLPAYSVPSSIEIVETLPVNRNGKVDRHALLAAPRPGSSRSRLPASEAAIVESLSEAWRVILKRDDVDVEEDFFDGGGDSLDALRLQMEVHERFDIDLPLDVLVGHPTITALARWLDAARMSRGPGHALTILQSEGTGVPLFCAPSIGGETWGFQSLAKHVGTRRPVYGLRLANDVSVDGQSIDAIASECVSQIDSVLDPAWPVLLCGHSFGGLVVFEMARQLRDAGRHVGFLGIIDTPLRAGDARGRLGRTRDLLANLPAWIKYDMLESGWRNLAIRALGKVELAWRRDSAMNFRAYFGVLRLPERFQQIVAARYEAARRYRPQVYVGSMVVFRARAQALTGRRDRHQGWAAFVDGDVEVFDVPGHHDSCVDEPYVRHVADVLNARLAALES